MRRSFNKSLLPKKPPKKSDSLNVGSSFNCWFRCMLADNNISAEQFSGLIDEPYSTVTQWRWKHNPQPWGQSRIALGLEKIGAGTYDVLRKKIRDLCAKR